MYYNLRKEILKSVIIIGFILLFAIVSIYYIYNKFQDDRSVDFNSESLDVTYHESTGDEISLSKIIPVTDSVGLSSKAYNVTIKNNLTEKVNYKLRVIEDNEKILKDGCKDSLISYDNIKISVKEGNKESKIFYFNELDLGLLLESKLNAMETKEIAIRVWIDKNSSLPLGASMHYHGKIQVIEDDRSIAINN